MSVCCLSAFFRRSLITRAVGGPFPQTRFQWKRESMGSSLGLVPSHVVAAVVATAGLLRTPWWFSGAAGFLFVLGGFRSSTHGLLQGRGFLASLAFPLVTRTRFAREAKKPLRTGVRTGFFFVVVSPSALGVRSVCVLWQYHRFRELHEADSHKPGIYGGKSVCANA